jgi:hypothetical protein
MDESPPTTESLTNREFLGIRDKTFPVLTLHADQWGEHGYFFDPVTRQYGFYEIDRKEQTDRVVRYPSADTMIAVSSHPERITQWFMAGA